MNKVQDNLIQQKRFQGLERVYGKLAKEKFSNAHICVIGLGGVGSWAVEALARSAIGRLTLIDLDNVALSNINRQIHALDETIGIPKVQVMQQRIHLINPDCDVTVIEDFISIENIENLLKTKFDFVIDCIDDFRVKAALTAHCKRYKIKLILTGGAGGQTNPKHIKIADLSRSENDPLLAKVRRLLRQDYRFPKNLKRRFDIPCIYSDEQLRYPTPDGETTFEKNLSDSTTGLNCSQGFGSAIAVTASFGLYAASHVLNKVAAT